MAAIAGTAFVVCFDALLDLAQLFDQGDRVSLFFPIAALCLVFGYLLGPAYLWVPIVGVFLADTWPLPSVAAASSDTVHIVRQSILYGAAGALLRSRLARRQPHGKLHRVGAMIAIAIAAVLVNLVPALLLFAHEGWLARTDVPSVALVFFLGDLSGILLLAPPALLLLDRLLDRRLDWPPPGLATTRDRLVAGALFVAGAACVVFAVTVFSDHASLIAALAPAVLPILAGAMLFGYAIGIGLLSLVTVLLLAVSASIADPPSALALQTVLIVSSVATLFVGAATSDRARLIARLDASVAERTRHLDATNASLLEVNAELQAVATTDHLTGLPNRRAFDQHFHQRLVDGQPGFGLLLVDVDRFKRINDRLGHQVGDAALVHVARLLTAAVRSDDVVARVGGEEFAVLCHALDERQLRDLADRLRRAVRAVPLRCGDTSDLLQLRVSIGGVLAGPTDDGDCLLRAADRALYAAKRAGRDRTRISESPDRLTVAAGTT